MARLGFVDQEGNVSHISSSSSYTPVKKKKKKDEEVKVTVNDNKSSDIRTIKTEDTKKDKSIIEKAATVGKGVLSGLARGVTGIADTPMQGAREQLQKGEKNKTQEDMIKDAAVGMLRASSPLANALLKNKETSNAIKKTIKSKDKGTLEKIVNSGLIAVGNTPDNTYQGINAALRGSGALDNSLDEKVANFQEIIDKPSQNYQQKVAQEAQEIGGLTNTLTNVGQQIGNMAPSIATTAITKNPSAGLAVMGVSAKGQATNEALQSGADIETANRIGTGKGLTEVGTELATGGLKIFGKGALDDVAKGFIDKKVGKAGLNWLAKQGLGIAGEMGEEVVSDLVGTLIDKGTIDPNANYTPQDLLNTITSTGLTTLLLNGITGGYTPRAYRQNLVEMQESRGNNGNTNNNTNNVVPDTKQVREIVEQKNNGEIDAEEANNRLADVQNGTYQQNQNNEVVIQEAQRQFDAINQAEQSGQIDSQTANQERQAIINTMSQMQQVNQIDIVEPEYDDNLGPVAKAVDNVMYKAQGSPDETRSYVGIKKTPTYDEIVDKKLKQRSEYLNDTMSNLSKPQEQNNKAERVENQTIKVEQEKKISPLDVLTKSERQKYNKIREKQANKEPLSVKDKETLRSFQNKWNNYKEVQQRKEQGIKNPELNSNITKFEDVKSGYKYVKNFDESKFDSTMVNKAKDIVSANKQGRRTKEQWLDVAKNIGMQADNLDSKALEKLAFESWAYTSPNQKDTLNRQGAKNVPFGVQEWVKAVYEGARVGTKIETQEETPKAQETKTPKVEENKKTAQEVSLKYAKQYYKRNLGKYEPGDAFESAIGEYYLRPEEAENLKEYAIKNFGYADEINRRYNDLYEQEETTKIEEQSKEEPKAEQPKVEEKPKIETKEQEQEYLEDNGVPKENAKVLSEMPKPPKESLSERIKNKKASVAEEIAYVKRNIVDKGEAIYSLSKKTKNKLLYAKYDKRGTTTGEANYDIGVAQTDLNGKKYSNFTNKKGKKVSMGLNDIWKDVDTQAANEYLAHWLNVDRYKQVNQKGLEMQDALQKQIDEGKLTQQEADKIIQNNEGTKYVFGPDITDEVSKQKIAELEEQHPELKQFGENIWQYGRNQLQNMVDAGMISEQQAKQYSKDTPHYVRLQRDIPKDSTSMIVFDKNGNAKVNKQIKEFSGSTLNILPFKETMANYTLDVRNSIRDNLFAEELAKTLGMSATGENITSVDDIMGINPELIKDNGDGTYSLTFFNKGNATTMPITQGIYEALQPNKHYKFEDIALFKGVRKFDSVRKALLTDKNPMFLATNMMKDLFDAPLNSKHPIAFAKNYPRAIEQVLRNGKYYQQYQALGGLQNSYFENNEFKNKGSMKNPLNWIAKANNAIEQFPRLAEFMSTMEKTGNIDEAMYNAAEITTNFKRGGDVAKAANRNGATFLNASIQGFSKQWRNFSDIQNPKQATQMLLKVMILGIAPALINDLVYEDDDEYKEMQDYQKDRYYLLKGKDGEWIRIPKGRAVSIFQSAARRTKYALGGDQNAFKEFTKFASSQVAPNNPFENNIISPFVDVSRNESWSGSKIIPQSMEKKKAEKQYNEKTDKLSRKISEEVNKNEFLKRIIPKNFRSAMGINYLIDQYSGAIGDVGLPYITPKATSKDRNPLAAPILDKFTTDVIYNNKNVGAFYDTMNSLAEEDETPVDRAKNNYMNSKSYALSQLYKQQRNIQSDESLSKSEKYEKAREVQKEINKFTKDTVKAVNNIQQEEYYLKIGDSYYKRVVQDGEEKYVQDTSKKIPTEKYALYDYFREKYEKNKEDKK